MKAFASAARLTVTLTRPGCDPVPVEMQAPPFGWFRQFQDAFKAPVLNKSTMVNGSMVRTEVEDTAGMNLYSHQMGVLLAGKMISEAGGLDRKYPDPLPNRASMVRLATEIEEEFKGANLRGAEVQKLASAALSLAVGDLPDIEQARELGNDSPPSGAP